MRAALLHVRSPAAQARSAWLDARTLCPLVGLLAIVTMPVSDPCELVLARTRWPRVV
jgi:hypothetical protein